MTGLACLVTAIFFEARDQPLMGQYAVAEVVMNRVASVKYPDDICSVVFQRKQFSFTHDGLSDKISRYTNNEIERRAAVIAVTVAKDVLGRGTTEIPSTHYHNTSVEPYWAKYYILDGKIGDHIFYTRTKGK
jgi:spore germination cell wall hydrolase CwlJ-like protein